MFSIMLRTRQPWPGAQCRVSANRTFVIHDGDWFLFVRVQCSSAQLPTVLNIKFHHREIRGRLPNSEHIK